MEIQYFEASLKARRAGNFNDYWITGDSLTQLHLGMARLGYVTLRSLTEPYRALSTQPKQRKAKPSQTKLNQAKSSQTNVNQTKLNNTMFTYPNLNKAKERYKPNQTKQNQAKSSQTEANQNKLNNTLSSQPNLIQSNPNQAEITQGGRGRRRWIRAKQYKRRFQNFLAYIRLVKTEM